MNFTLFLLLSIYALFTLATSSSAKSIATETNEESSIIQQLANMFDDQLMRRLQYDYYGTGTYAGGDGEDGEDGEDGDDDDGDSGSASGESGDSASGSDDDDDDGDSG